MRSSASRLCWALAFCGACGEQNGLSGSIGRTHPLDFETVQVRRLGHSYAVVYLRGAETVARLAYQGPVAVDMPLPLDFGRGGNAGLSRATAEGLQFPQAKSGTLTFFTDVSAAVAGQAVRGRFGVEFTSGDTLSGTFAAPLGVAER